MVCGIIKKYLTLFFFLNKKVTGARSGARVTVDLRAYAWIIASHLDCSVTGNQPKPVVWGVCVAFTMTETAEQSICIKYCQKLGHSCSENYDMIQKAFGNKAMGRTRIKEWFKQFKEGWTSVESDKSSGSLSTSRNQLMIDKVHSAMLDNCRITITELSDELGL